MRLVDQDIDWHDGNLVDVQINGLPGAKQTLRLFLDLFPDDENADRRSRYCCTGESLKRVLFSATTARIRKHSKSGNIDYMRLEQGEGREILTLSLFGGVIEAEADHFQLAEFRT